MYKFIILFTIIVVVSCDLASEEQKKKFEQYNDECYPISKADPELVNKTCKGEFVDDAKLKEHIFCVSKKAGFQNEEGDLLQDNIRAELNECIKDEARVEAMMKKCSIKSKTPVETAFDVAKCFMNEKLAFKKEQEGKKEEKKEEKKE